MWFVVIDHVAGYSSNEVAGSGHTDSHIVLGFSGPFDCDAVFVSDDVHFITCERLGEVVFPLLRKSAGCQSFFSFSTISTVLASLIRCTLPLGDIAFLGANFLSSCPW